MPASVNLDEFLTHTEWERVSWHSWFPRYAPAAFATGLGPHGDGRLKTVADVIRHVFSAEMRYVDRLSGRPLTDPASIPSEFEPLFEFGRRSRRELRTLVETLPAARWDVPESHTILDQKLRLTPRKIVVHVLLHEIRHWAQIATVLRQNGFKCDSHDFLFSPALGGDPRIAAPD